MNEDNENIQHLLSEVCSGNRAGMEQLAGIVRQRLYSFVFRATLNHDLTEDVLQETLLTMVGQIACLREERKFWPWVFRIAYNKLQDNHKRHRHQSSGRASFIRNQSHEGRTRSGNLLEDTIHAERLQQLSEVIEQLSRQHRDILRLRYYEKLPYTDSDTDTHNTPEGTRSIPPRQKIS